MKREVEGTEVLNALNTLNEYYLPQEAWMLIFARVGELPFKFIDELMKNEKYRMIAEDAQFSLQTYRITKIEIFLIYSAYNFIEMNYRSLSCVSYTFSSYIHDFIKIQYYFNRTRSNWILSHFLDKNFPSLTIDMHNNPQWYDIAEEYVEENKEDEKEKNRREEMAKHLKNIERMPRPNRYLDESIKQMTYLTAIDFDLTLSTERRFSYEILSNLTNLNRLSLPIDLEHDKHDSSSLNILTLLSNLKSLRCIRESISGDCLEKLTNLTSLALILVNSTSEHFNYFSDTISERSIKKLTNLTSLQISDNILSNECMQQLKSLKTLKLMQSAEVSENALINLPNLTSLQIFHNNSIKDECIMQLTNLLELSLFRLPRLKNLILDEF